MRVRPLALAAVSGLVLITVAGTGGATGVTAAGGSLPTGHHHGPSTPQGPTTVAEGLDNPRLLSFDRGALYVAEAGVGGEGPCAEGPEGLTCLGATGAVTRITWHTQRSRTLKKSKHARHHGEVRTRTVQRRVLTGLPSLAGEGGNQAGGPTDVTVRGKHYALTLSLGNDPAVRPTFGDAGALLGTVVHGALGHKPRGHGSHKYGSTPRLLADLAAFEAANDPDGAGPDSNPTGITPTHRGLAVTDSGGNTLLEVDRRGRARLVATFGERMVPTPPFLPPGEMPMQSVPTSVAVGPDRAYYVSELTGFPFPAGESTIWRVVPGNAPVAYASGLTNVTDLAWHRGHLYAVQLTDDGLLNAPEDSLPLGSLQRVNRDGSTSTVVDGLPAPYGVALRGDSAYVTTCSVCAAGGSVVKVPLR